VTLREKIEEEVRQHGPLPFSRYMELCLYDPELGYYSRPQEKFGKAGDFYTSSDVHAVFGRLLARQFEEMWRVLGAPAEITLLELGPGRGLFAQDVLDWSAKKFPEFSRALRYVLWEQSSQLRQRLIHIVSRYSENGKAVLPDEGLTLLAQLGERKGGTASTGPGPVIVFGNEFFDAFPVEVVSPEGSLRISARDGRFVENWAPASPEELKFLDLHGVHPETGERVEVALAANRYMREVAAAMARGFFVTVDYGYTREEQLAGRHRGTVMTYRQHSAGANPYEAPGEQDITAHVNFTALAAAARESGLQVEKLRTQSQFLMGIGEANEFADAFEDCRLPQERAKVALQLKHLVTPMGMGETFQVLMASKGVSAGGLSGLKFG
jgi:SAM-dependent MidA family methyltransferase